MSNLEYIEFHLAREVVEAGTARWELDALARSISRLPQIFWSTGEGWAEANDWAIERARGIHGAHIKTVTALMKHLYAYSCWLEEEGCDWRHFPANRSGSVLARYRKDLIDLRDSGHLKPSTTSARMGAVIQFYRYAQIRGFVSHESPMWVDRMAAIRYFDSMGFERTLKRLVSDLSIPNRARPGLVLEDGLTPLRGEHMKELLQFTASERLEEMHLMLSMGFFTGARIGTITTLNVRNIEGAMPDLTMPNFYRIAVGPGTGVSTKFNVTGDLLVPHFLIKTLRGYAYSMERLGRQAKASTEFCDVLFLTSRGNPYRERSFNRLMTEIRRRAVRCGHHFMRNFKFHQTRSTYGTWLMELALRVANEAAAIAFVRDAMLHKKEATTLRYVRFIRETRVKAAVSNEFSEVFSGIKDRDWRRFRA
ncbi:tyrosine-type recombinase/integrase (plasmid) [Ralstonia sp. 25C]|uniref:tyrosine-type recombinase/integrase n=1 Tax=Ralstonia sp. 25C TaxID=3447363 RepID=UPI003F74DD6C